MLTKSKIPLLLITAAILTSCEEDKESNSPPVDYNSQGVYIVNEGGFMAGNASVSYLDIDNFTMVNDIFAEANGVPLGDVAQSMTISGGKGYIVVNNSQKVEVVDLTDFSSVATISGFSGPRFMQVWNSKGFVTDWFSNEIKVIDLNSNTITNTIAAGSGPEQLCVSNNKLYVVNVGGFDSDSTVTIVDPASESVLATAQVGLNPNSVVADLNGAIWVLCGGSLGPDFTPSTSDDIAGSLWKINPASFAATEMYTFPQNGHPVKMQRDGAGRYMYFLSGSSNYTGIISKFDAVPANVNIVTVVNKNFYGLGVDPGSGHLYGGTAPGFTQNGWVYRYEGGGVFVDSAQAGIAPGYFTFKP